MSSHRFHVTVNPLRHPTVFSLIECNPRKVATEILLDAAEEYLALRHKHGPAFDALIKLAAQNGGVMPTLPFGTMLGAQGASAPAAPAQPAAVNEAAPAADFAKAGETVDEVLAGFGS